MKEKDIHSNLPPKENWGKHKTPEGYFEQNAIQLKRIAQEVPQKETKVFKLNPFVSWMSAAAVVALVIFGVLNRSTTTTDSLTEDDLYELVELGYVSFNSDVMLSDLDLDNVDIYGLETYDTQDYLENSDLYYLEENILYESY